MRMSNQKAAVLAAALWPGFAAPGVLKRSHGRIRWCGLQGLALSVLFALVLASPWPAFAYGEQITQAGIQLYTWLRGLGAVIMAIGFAFVGFKLMVQHDREGLTPFFYVIGGGLIMMLAPSAVQLIQGVSGGAAAINTSGL